MPTLKRHGPFKGLNTRDSNLSTKDGYCIDCDNVQQTPDGDLEKRPGFDHQADDVGSGGIAAHDDDTLLAVQSTTVGAQTASLNVFESSSWSTAKEYESQPLVTTKQQLADFANYNGNTYIAQEASADGGSYIRKYDGTALYKAGIGRVGSPAAGTHSQSAVSQTFAATDVDTSTDRINITAHGFNTGDRVLVTPSGAITNLPVFEGIAHDSNFDDYLVLYIIDDSTDYIKLAARYEDADLGNALDITAAGSGSGHSIDATDSTYAYNITDGDYKVLAELETSDKNGTIAYSGWQETDEVTIGPATSNTALTYRFKYMVSTGTPTTIVNGFRDHFGYNKGPNQYGSGPSPTFTLDSGHDIEEDDYVYLRTAQAETGTYELFRVSSVASQVITIDNPNQTPLYLQAGDGVSTALMNLYWDKDGDGYQYSRSLPVQIVGGASNFIVRGVLAVADSGADYIFPTIERRHPPRAKYIEFWQDVMFLGGVTRLDYIRTGANEDFNPVEQPNTLFYSSTTEGVLDSVEVFPEGENQIAVGDDSEGPITGIRVNNGALVIFKKKAIYVLSGNIILNQVRLQRVIANDVGCVSHSTIKEVNGWLYFLDDRGVFRYRAGYEAPEQISDVIFPEFQDTTLDWQYASATHDTKNQKYVMYVPNTTATTNGTVFVHDYYRDAWWKWGDVNFTGGIEFFEDEINALGADYSHFKETDTRQDDVDGASNANINWLIQFPWESLGEPAVSKRFTEVKAYSLNATDEFSIAFETYKNWDESDPTTENELTFSSDAKLAEKKFTAGFNNMKSLSIKMTHEVAGNVKITGYEIEYEGQIYESKKFEGN